MAKLLIVDDEQDVRDFAANFFRKRNIDTDTASSGEEAIEKVKISLPDLVLLDIRMQGMTGIQALEAIKKIHSAIKVIMVTGTRPDENEAYKKCLELGASGYLHKPLQLDELEKVVLSMLKAPANSST
ncbi:MAG: response regulator [Candidatus Omnitrophica bacterium]|nr:response regulator [Candidatus Omnitrophota bacterium]